eukprot:1860142-Prymnesium_polylepis.1
MRDPCMGRRPRTDRDEHEGAQTRAEGCRSGARRSGRRRVPPFCCVNRQAKSACYPNYGWDMLVST